MWYTIFEVEDFNSRSPEESDIKKALNYFNELEISIHALLKRATLKSFSLLSTISYFNSRSPEESDYSNHTKV